MTITIAGYDIPVFSITEFPDDPLQLGEFDHMTYEIHIRSTLPDGIPMVDTLIHEVIHAICHIALASEDRLAERQVTTLSTILIDTLFRNPKLRKCLEERWNG